MIPTLDSTWLNIGKRRQFFFDDLMLEQIQDVTRRFHFPEKVTEPLLSSDQPWEHVTFFSTNTWNVIRDPQDMLFKCWYEDFCFHDPKSIPTWINETDGKLCVDFHGACQSRICYAQSTDGLRWEKPPVGIREDGHDTNIVLGGPGVGFAHCAYVMLDLFESDPSKRFKALFEYRRVEHGNDMTGEGGFRAASSGDGIHWDIWNEPVSFGECGEVLGDVVTVSRNPDNGIYWVNNRHPAMCSSSVQDRRKPVQPSWICPSYPQKLAQENRRRVFRSESSDFTTWSTPQLLIPLDSESDNIDDSFYGMEQFQIGSDWLGFLNVFHMTDNHLDVQLAYSRNGQDFARIRPGEPWLQPSKTGWDSTEVSTCSKPILVGDELFVYYGGSNVHHDWWITGIHEGLKVPEAHDPSLVGYSLGLAKLKVDRFVSISSAEAREGLMVTPAVFPSGKHLVINARTWNGGMIRIAMADGQDRVIEGYDKDTCIPLIGDSTTHAVRWKSQLGLPSNNFLKLHFYLRNADLYSFQFCD